MKILAILLSAIPILAFGEESYFFTLAGKPTGQRADGKSLHLVIPIQKIDAPKASSIVAFHQGLGPGREYQIQVNLKSVPNEGWMPMVKLGEEIFTDGISVSRPSDPKFAASFSLEGDNPEKIKQWCEILGGLLNVPKARIQIDLTKAVKGGAEQPAARPMSKPEGGDKPQSESGGVSR